MPASSTMRLSCTSPQRPRTSDERSAETSLVVSVWIPRLRLDEPADLRAHGSLGLAPCLLEPVHPGRDLVERLLQRADQPLDSALARFEVVTGVALQIRRERLEGRLELIAKHAAALELPSRGVRADRA